MEVILLNWYPQYVEATCDLVNSEWPVTTEMRMKMHQLRYHETPASIIVVSNGNVIAHCALEIAPHDPKLGILDSVVVYPEMQRRGIGRFIMQNVEEYSKWFGIKTLYMKTCDMEIFFKKVGYTRCDPPILYYYESNTALVIRFIQQMAAGSSSSVTFLRPHNQSPSIPIQAALQNNSPAECVEQFLI